MTYDSIERSVASSSPIELFTFTTPTKVYRLTSYERDVAYGGWIFTASAGTTRSSLSIVDFATDQSDVTVSMIASHDLVQAYSGGVPTREISVLVQQYQPKSGVALQMWYGYTSGLTIKGRIASFRVPSGLGDRLQMDIPSVVASRLCNHFLYDARCTISRTDPRYFRNTSCVSAVGKTIAVANPDNPALSIQFPDWAVHGEVVHQASSERRTIVDLYSATVGGVLLRGFVVECPFPNDVVQPLDLLVIYAGCNHIVQTCKAKFSNVLNFGGHPNLPKSNLFYVGITTAKY